MFDYKLLMGELAVQYKPVESRAPTHSSPILQETHICMSGNGI